AYFTRYRLSRSKGAIMSPRTRNAKQQIKARQRRRLHAQERLARDRRQAQHAAEALQQALDDLDLPEDLVIEIEGRLRSQQKLLGKIFHIPPNYVVEDGTTQRKPPEVRIWTLRNQSRVGTCPPSTSTPHFPACLARC